MKDPAAREKIRRALGDVMEEFNGNHPFMEERDHRLAKEMEGWFLMTRIRYPSPKAEGARIEDDPYFHPMTWKGYLKSAWREFWR